MKKTVFLVAVIATACVQNLFAQDSTAASGLSGLLTQYYAIKDALVAGKATIASASAAQFVKTLHGLQQGIVPAESKAALLKDAAPVAASSEVGKQREAFAALSTDMIVLAKSARLSSEPVYQQYCPMKKANWLSSDKAIKNPYYGSSMLTCGKVVETFNQ
ncbi:MAG: DUF3347 domain-containing protein [Williamsia sp.]|nr:DUF3347 domain-containing protein [Williamsia sp.]